MYRYILLFNIFGFFYFSNRLNAQGGNLFPIKPTNIELLKEKIDIKYVPKRGFLIEVDYEFFNPGKEATVEFGFKQYAPHYDCDHLYDTSKINIRNLQMEMNGKSLPFKLSLVDENLLDKKALISPIIVTSKDHRYHDKGHKHGYLLYLYHAKAKFTKGVNHIHTSHYFHQNYIDLMYYVWGFHLNTFRNWKTKFVKDFEISIEPAPFSRFEIERSFFKDSRDWSIQGAVFIKDSIYYKWNPEEEDMKTEFPPDSLSEFMFRSGSIRFKKLNFCLNKDLSIISKELYSTNMSPWDYRSDDIPFEQLIYGYSDSLLVVDNKSLQILQNFPYARRGCVFEDPLVKEFYGKLDWYIPNASYLRKESDLTPEEEEWLKTLYIVNIDNPLTEPAPR